MRTIHAVRPLGPLRALRPLCHRPRPRDLHVCAHAGATSIAVTKPATSSAGTIRSCLILLPFLSVSSRRLRTPRGSPRGNDAQVVAESPRLAETGAIGLLIGRRGRRVVNGVVEPHGLPDITTGVCAVGAQGVEEAGEGLTSLRGERCDPRPELLADDLVQA